METKKLPIEVQVYNNLERLTPGTVIRVCDEAKKNPALFIDIVKQCIVAGCPVEFNGDYTKIKRIDPARLTENVIDYGRNPDDAK